ncbi:hypothetical protein CAC42_8043 [Sphaceloma murrayae]|uniref:Kinetochore protein mis14 n=1 Tax=Sphaceloma murrayae TaxID=2082308 RepID=A0A2K1QRE5_9PEZI|nr:hypothetical protein CAC42_8043 [Sphaceloma murrayae]
MDSTHRKIDLQSPSDYQHLLSSASLIARQQIDLHFPRDVVAPSTPRVSTGDATTGDPMRRRVEELVQGYIERTFEGVKGNVSVNGMEGAELERVLGEGGVGEETEAFDHRLARRIQSVASEIEDLQLQLANVRRTAPARAAEGYTAALERETKMWREEIGRAEEVEMERAREVKLEVEGLEGMEDMKRSWEEGTRRLMEVKGGIGGVVGKSERAKEGVGYLEGS